MSTRTPAGDEHELPSLEAVLAGTLALMTGYSQALQAALHPEKRLAMGAKIGWQLEVLAGSAQLSPGFREVLRDLRRHWQSMTTCTLDSQPLARAQRETAGVSAPATWPAEEALPPHRLH